MVINERTKVSAVIKENKKSIDALASLAKPLSKLKNPLLRKVLASRVTLLEASKMGGCTVADMAKALAPLGFEYRPEATEDTFNQQDAPDWLRKLKQEQITSFDVRPILDEGGDPLKAIMQHFKGVEKGEALRVIVGFEPVPLVNRLTRKGDVEAFTQMVNPEEYHTYFFKGKGKPQKDTTKATSKQEPDIIHDTEEGFKAVCERYDAAHTKEIDVRALEMPGPRMKIHEELKQLPDNHALYVNHKRVPVYLLEDLAEMDYEVHIWEVAEKDVRMLLFKAK